MRWKNWYTQFKEYNISKPWKKLLKEKKVKRQENSYKNKKRK